jgi:hypothetical protein
MESEKAASPLRGRRPARRALEAAARTALRDQLRSARGAVALLSVELAAEVSVDGAVLGGLDVSLELVELLFVLAFEFIVPVPVDVVLVGADCVLASVFIVLELVEFGCAGVVELLYWFWLVLWLVSVCAIATPMAAKSAAAAAVAVNCFWYFRMGFSCGEVVGWPGLHPSKGVKPGFGFRASRMPCPSRNLKGDRGRAGAWRAGAARDTPADQLRSERGAGIEDEPAVPDSDDGVLDVVDELVLP